MTEPTAERIADVSTVRPDPIGCDFSLPLKAIFHPLGFPVEIATNCADVLAAAEENWKSFDKDLLRYRSSSTSRSARATQVYVRLLPLTGDNAIW